MGKKDVRKSLVQHVYEKFLAPMEKFFGISAKDAETFRDQVSKDLKGYSGDVLSAAQEHFVREKKHTTMPTISEMIGVCERISEAFSVLDPGKKTAYEKLREDRERTEKAWSEPRKKWAKEKLLDCPFAKQAAQEDWINFLYDHYRYNDYMPNHPQIEDMKEGYKGQQVSRQKPAARVYRHLFEKSDKLRKELKDFVLHGVAS